MPRLREDLFMPNGRQNLLSPLILFFLRRATGKAAILGPSSPWARAFGSRQCMRTPGQGAQGRLNIVIVVCRSILNSFLSIGRAGRQ